MLYFKTMQDYIRGTIVGGAIGDAFGMPCEGMPKEEIAKRYGQVTSYQDSEYAKYTKGLKKGQYTDDTQLTLATLESLIEKNGVDIEDIGKKFVELYRTKSLRGAGRTTQAALKKILCGASALESGIEKGYGCGAAMRISPIGLIKDGKNKELLVADVARITHKNSLAVASSMAVAFSIGCLLGGTNHVDTLEQKKEFLDFVAQWSNYEPPSNELDFSEKIKEMAQFIEEDFSQLADRIGVSGLATESVVLAIFSFLKEPRDFQKLLVQSTNCGGDTDSIAAIAGNLFGAYNGYTAIPVSLRIYLENSDKIVKLADGFAESIK